jgi:hypothetical protein
MTREEDSAWVPAAIRQGKRGVVVEWRHVGTLRFIHPFFRDTIKAADDTAAHETTLERLGELAAGHPGLPPAGFIFHLSRCGSTLLTQMLARLPQHVVLSEPSPVNDLLWPAVTFGDEAQRVTWLRWLLSVLGRRRHPDERRLFVKFDSWQTLDLPLIRAAFPNVPWIFVYRDPAAILASHALSPGSQMIPGFLDQGRIGVPRPPWTETGLRTYAAQVLARIASAAFEHLDADARLVHYDELPPALEPVLRHFHVAASPDEFTAMLAAAAQHSKEPWRPFIPDKNLRQAQATGALRSIAEESIGDLYAQLETRRFAQPPR